MESIIYQDSPLAEFLEGEGIAEPEWAATAEDAKTPSLSASPPHDFAPRGASTLHSRLRDKLPKPLKIPLPGQGPVARLRSACSKAVNSRIGRAENQRFLEHFRYLIVASHLLSDTFGQTGFRSVSGPLGLEGPTPSVPEYKGATTSVTGVVAICGATFALVWLIHWARVSRSSGRSLVVVAIFAAAVCFVYIYVRRQWLQYLRQQAVEAASTLVTNLQAYDASTASALSFIQEVELISRGYRISSPLPPITRLEEKDQNRRCARLRRAVRHALAAAVTPFLDQCGVLKELIDEDDLEKYLDVYDITNPDLQEAALGYTEEEFDDSDSLKVLRILQYRQTILRRVFLCSLLALEADGGKADIQRWRIVTESMEILASITGTWSEKINSILTEEEQFSVQPPPQRVPMSPDREQLKSQVRKLSSLSQGIRGLQAKMQILREESTKAFEFSEDVSEFGSALMSHYESIGADLKCLMKAWEDGKASLTSSIDRAERRISQTSSGLRSPALSLGGLTAVEEGSPFDALRALNGEVPLRAVPTSTSSNASDEEIFEAIAIPRQRPRMTAEERRAKIAEDRAKHASLREQREATTNMLRELESVIRLRPSRPQSEGRIPSL